MSRLTHYVAPYATICLLGMYGCATTPHVPLEAPIRPIFKEYSTPLWQSLPTEAMENIVADDLACKRYIRSAEDRIRIHNGK